MLIRAYRIRGHLVADLDPARLAVTLPGFHVTPAYLERFIVALKETNGSCHTAQVREAVAFVAARRGTVGALEDVYARGNLGRRDRGDGVLRDSGRNEAREGE